MTQVRLEDFGPGDVTGFTLAAWLRPDKKYHLAGSGQILKKFPKVIECNGVEYTLEAVKHVWAAGHLNGIFVNADYV